MSVSSYANDILESDASFRNQFDPDHPSYHGKGDSSNHSSKAVPTGNDKRVPDSMKGPEILASGAERVIDYGKEYVVLMDKRKALEDLKKEISKVCPPIERILKLQEKAAKKSNVSKKLLDEIEKFEEKKDEAISKVESFSEIFNDDSEMGKRICELIDLIVVGATKEYEDDESYKEFVMEVRKITQQIFKDSRTVLQEIKAIKRAHTREH